MPRREACAIIIHTMDNHGHYEIERKFLIRRPEESELRPLASASDIVQTYLLAPKGTTERVRSRTQDGRTVYTHTRKRRLSDRRRIEEEREISLEEYGELLLRADPDCREIRKRRWVLPYRGQLFEIDVFPFWQRQAYLELELEDEAQTIEFPPEITLIREVTGDRRYTNAALAREIPAEDDNEV